MFSTSGSIIVPFVGASKYPTERPLWPRTPSAIPLSDGTRLPPRGWLEASGLRTTGVAPGWRPEGWRHGCRPLGDHQEGTDSQLQARASLRSAPDGWPV